MGSRIYFITLDKPHFGFSTGKIIYIGKGVVVDKWAA